MFLQCGHEPADNAMRGALVGAGCRHHAFGEIGSAHRAIAQSVFGAPFIYAQPFHTFGNQRCRLARRAHCIGYRFMGEKTIVHLPGRGPGGSGDPGWLRRPDPEVQIASVGAPGCIGGAGGRVIFTTFQTA